MDTPQINTTAEIQAIINLATRFINELELIKKEAISKLPPKSAPSDMFLRNPLTGEKTFYDKNKHSNCLNEFDKHRSAPIVCLIG